VSERKRVVVVDDEPDLRRLLRDGLTFGGFEVHDFADPRDALMKLHELAPDLIVCDVTMPDMDGRTFFQVVKRSEQLKDVPFLFLSALQASDEIVALLDGGADDFVAKPFQLKRLVAKVRAMLRLAERRGGEGGAPLSGDVSPRGTLPLLKFCEDSRLTGRLLVETRGGSRWAEFLGGELLHAGGPPGAPGEDTLDALLAVTEGTYRIEQKPLDAVALQAAEERARNTAEETTPAAAEGPALLPGGRLSTVESGTEPLQVQTEAENRPNYTIVTVVARGGQVLRKVEKAWEFPLQRREDQALARSELDRQHAMVLDALRQLGASSAAATPAAAPAPPPDADGSLLAWAVSFLAERAQTYLGLVTTVALLRRSQRALGAGAPVLSRFHVAENGRVVFDGTEGPRVSASGVAEVAQWSAAFLADAGLEVEKAGGLRIRRVTHMIEGELDRAGFYAAFESAYRALRPGAGEL
jgi:CheY-like chemotaxis protein